jgi:hypothetical protein
MIAMTGNNAGNPVTHFGRQMRKERLARGWTLREMSTHTGVAFAHLSRIETGNRPPTEAVADACDVVFPDRRGWFREYYEESKSWSPAGFRSWGEYEDKATDIRAWSPGVLHGLLQTQAYAEALLETMPGADTGPLGIRLRARLDRQRRVLDRRDDPPSAWFIVDQLSLYREVGDAGVMADQMRHLASIARRPNVTLQILPAVAHPAGASGFIVTEEAGYAEHVVGGFTYTDRETVSRLAALFTTIHSESFRASESLALIEEVGEIWTGARQATATQTAGTV